MNKSQKVTSVIFTILAIILITNQLINDFTFNL
jgi:hypothetical protein